MSAELIPFPREAAPDPEALRRSAAAMLESARILGQGLERLGPLLASLEALLRAEAARSDKPGPA